MSREGVGPTKEIPMPNERERARVIRKALKTEDNKRFLRSLPIFQIAPTLQSEILEKLRRLEQAERKRYKRHRSAS
jgi:hypothetical protein